MSVTENWHNPFTYRAPREIHFGPGQSANLGQRARDLGATRALLVVDAVVWQTGIAESAVRSLEDAGVGYELFTDVEPEPSVEGIAPCIELARGKQIDVLIAIGGGSSIDTAKGTGTVLSNGGDLLEYLTGGKPIDRPLPPIIAIPSTAGTGSEVSPVAAIGHRATDFKGAIFNSRLVPTIAIVDPELTYGKPAVLTANTGIDALTHAIECHINTNFHPLADALALEAIRVITQWLPAVVANGRDREARIHMHYGSLLAGLAFGNAGTGDGHSLSGPLGSLFHVPHGRALGVLTPAVLEYNLSECADKLANVARAMGEDTTGLAPETAGRRAIEAFRRIAARIGITERLGDFGVTEQHLPQMAEQSLKRSRWINPKKLTVEGAIEVFRAVM